eukprot:CAMPEP_0198689964 /NCGR_PEP_ID=MMETSP1468-20131203/158727_1 /TAXON_ID=1461545 /ORGANISM="Mantoniella sp, Strain CCMP1436" /LENGTH=81 /DNA_ID=CAMNT_0044441673 /DNA_START=1006 /DNA_END=1248 /DNA_ORIENTATION=-
MMHPATAAHGKAGPCDMHLRKRLPVSIVTEYQCLARRHGCMVEDRATEDGKAAIAHHASAALMTPDTHRGQLRRGPCRILW